MPGQAAMMTLSISELAGARGFAKESRYFSPCQEYNNIETLNDIYFTRFWIPYPKLLRPRCSCNIIDFASALASTERWQPYCCCNAIQDSFWQFIQSQGKKFNMTGLVWGRIARVRHVITYSLSPFEQRSMAGILKNGIPNVIRRFSESFPYVAPSLIMVVCVYKWSKKKFIELSRKNPADFANDE
ncbi:Cytochrome b-c1 complex subunit 8 [Trichoplax sp. H2]|nr:Cytochrome b-c1 complex subunit 8 [Trichoplax sp. H2]|eukprot:RDD37339.1 Cytochrome b-c1 complex subunit 8 [Trichoplax sp. H2]